VQFLKQGEFDSFDRYQFIKDYTNPQLELINKTADDWGVVLKTSRPLNPRSTNLFDKDFLNIDHFKPPHSPAITKDRVLLGEKMFNDISLSKTGDMSCASCHHADKAFTDGLKKSKGNDGSELLRNSPTLNYAVYQRSFFLDGTTSALESQIVGVLNNDKEFHMGLKMLEKKVGDNLQYKLGFDTLYAGKITNRNIRNAISTYIRSLAPFDSKFDRNMQGKENTLSNEEIKGFNLFMGKAACATCHFPPVFNGTIPPKFQETEFEKLGVPTFADFKYTEQTVDADPGMFYPYKVEERRGFFKTPTIRNAEFTGPYMHNGVYETLQEVIDFYDAGGGIGIGLEVPYQTLPSDSLGLTKAERDAIISFMKTLSDSSVTRISGNYTNTILE